jgi:scyllo-inositol 2-dehydrogenase (NAD+)
MPGEPVNHTYAGPMERETLHFLESIALGRQPLVTAEEARVVMRLYQAADQSAESGLPVDLTVDAVPTLR